MQTILGATGQIAVELACELQRTTAGDLRLVSRSPRKVNDTDILTPADLLDAGQAAEAVKGSSIVYFTAGLPPDTVLWETQFPLMLRNALAATRAAGAKFVYFDNTYMYPQDDRVLTEDAPFAPVGRKGRVRAEMASMVLQEMARGDIPVLIGRAPEAQGSFLDATKRGPGKLRVAFLRKPVGWQSMDPALVAAVERTAKRLEALGHHVEETTPAYDAAAAGEAFGTVMCANTFTNIQLRANGRVPGPGDLEPVTRLYAEKGRGISAHDYIRAVQTFHRTGRQLGAFFERFDILLSPTIARTSLPLGAVRMDGSLEHYEEGLAPMVAFTSVCNAAGVPAMSVPLEWTEDGLPIGMHFVARYGTEATLLSLAAQLEQEHPWRERRPGRVT